MKISHTLSRLLKDRGGNFGIITAVVTVPLLLAAGSAIDLTSAYVERTNMQNIADTAALAGAALYDGTNANEAIARAKAFLKGYEDKLPDGTTFKVSMSGQTVSVSVNGTVQNSMMAMAGMNTADIGVASQAIAPMRPKTIEFTPTQAQGWYWKKVTIRVVRPNTTTEEIVGTVTYQPTTQSNGGQGTMVVSPKGTLDLGKYTKLVLQMDIKYDGCNIGLQASVSNSKVTCKTSTRQQDKSYSMVLRTDDPAKSNYLFVEGKQLPAGVTSPLDDILVCGKTSNHAWEDGGGFDRQDFFYKVTTTCAPDGEFVRLTK